MARHQAVGSLESEVVVAVEIALAELAKLVFVKGDTLLCKDIQERSLTSW